MEGFRILNVHVVLDSHTIGGNTMLISFEVTWLGEHTCRQLLAHVLDIYLKRPEVPATVEHVTLFCVRGLVRVDKQMANATACLEFNVSFVIDSFSTLDFNFKLTSLPAQAQASSSRPVINPFVVMRNTQSAFVSLPPRLDHQRMYSNHHLYNEFLEFLENQDLGWTGDSASTIGKHFVECITKAFFQCNPGVWKCLNDKYKNGKFPLCCILLS
jgi:hypothetical protein